MWYILPMIGIKIALGAIVLSFVLLKTKMQSSIAS